MAANPKPPLLRTKLAEEVTRRQRGLHTGPVVTDARFTSHLLDLGSWPPTSRRLAPMLTMIAARAADGRIALCGVTVPSSPPNAPRPRTLRLVAGKTTEILDEAVPPAITIDGIDGLGFVGDELVLLPTEPTYRRGEVAQPHVLRGGRFVPLAVPAVTVAPFTPRSFPAFAVQGFARTGASTDVLLWGSSGYVAKPRFRRAYDLGELAPSEISTVAGPKDSFFLANDERVLEIRAGAPPRRRLARAGRIVAVAPGPEGVVLAALIRPVARQPIAIAWWPAQHEYAAIPGALFGQTKRDWFSQGHLGYHPRSKLVWGFEPVGDHLCAVAWDAIAALPRKPE